MQYACAVVAVLSTAHPALAQRTARPTVGQELRDTMAAVLRAGLAARAFPGAYAIVGDRRGILAETGVGRIDWPSDAPAPTRHTIWDVASLTKVVGTTTALAQLVEQGRVELHAPVQRYVPEWTGPMQERVRVWHLLTHTSGLPAFRPYDRQTQDPDSLDRLLFRTQLERSPGDSMVYSDIGAYMMGEVVERVSGRRLDQYLADAVFAPLRMSRTMFSPPESLRADVAPTEIDSLRGGLVRGKVHDERAYYLGGVAAHAGLFSTAADLARFATMLLRGGTLDGARILDAATIARFTAYADSGRHNRALGWQKTPAAWSGRALGADAYGHTGFTGTSLFIDPLAGVYGILLSNRVNPTRNNPRIGDVRAQFADAVMGVLRAHRASPTSSKDAP